MAQITITVELESEREALALAQFVKRVSLTTCETHADPTNKEEPYEMLAGLDAVRRGLDLVGFSPR